MFLQEAQNVAQHADDASGGIGCAGEEFADFLAVRLDPRIKVVELFGDPLNGVFHTFGGVTGLAAENGGQEVRTQAGDGGLHLVDGTLKGVAEPFGHSAGVGLNGFLQHVEGDFTVLLHLQELIGGQVVGLFDPGFGRHPGFHQLHHFFAGQFAFGLDLVEDQAHSLNVGAGEPCCVGDIGHKLFDVFDAAADGLGGGLERRIQGERCTGDRVGDRLNDVGDFLGGLPQPFELVLGCIENDEPVKAFSKR